ncbi:ORF73 [macacine gammaherpesvirus 12]|uniref:ORF73 n=2 Tax=macacine gammaherpesvirus 12 TaxID=2560571 RepID=A0A0B5CYY5_9GAMA|nr:ORF73 [Macaca nemestrina rhadinovirus 2]ABH07415.1 latency-associated nuclear antigen [Macaca nemestrina rhadinovirus 2]AJE29730.1 ORF73 [Macaca nemestrina rhadinovirus 2]
MWGSRQHRSGVVSGDGLRSSCRGRCAHGRGGARDQARGRRRGRGRSASTASAPPASPTPPETRPAAPLENQGRGSDTETATESRHGSSGASPSASSTGSVIVVGSPTQGPSSGPAVVLPPATSPRNTLGSSPTPTTLPPPSPPPNASPLSPAPHPSHSPSPAPQSLSSPPPSPTNSPRLPSATSSPHPQSSTNSPEQPPPQPPNRSPSTHTHHAASHTDHPLGARPQGSPLPGPSGPPGPPGEHLHVYTVQGWGASTHPGGVPSLRLRCTSHSSQEGGGPETHQEHGEGEQPLHPQRPPRPPRYPIPIPYPTSEDEVPRKYRPQRRFYRQALGNDKIDPPRPGPWRHGVIFCNDDPYSLYRLARCLQFPGIRSSSVRVLPDAPNSPVIPPFCITVFCQSRGTAKAVKRARRRWEQLHTSAPKFQASIIRMDRGLPIQH